MPSIERWTFAAEHGFDLCAEMGSWVPDVERLGERACVRTDLFRESVVDGLDRAAAQREVAPRTPCGPIVMIVASVRRIRRSGKSASGAMPRSWPSHAWRWESMSPGASCGCCR